MSRRRKNWPAGITLHAKLSFPIMNCKSRLVTLWCDSHWGISSIRSLSFSGGNLATSISESSSMSTLYLHWEVTNDTAGFVYLTQMLSDILLTVQF